MKKAKEIPPPKNIFPVRLPSNAQAQPPFTFLRHNEMLQPIIIKDRSYPLEDQINNILLLLYQWKCVVFMLVKAAYGNLCVLGTPYVESLHKIIYLSIICACLSLFVQAK